MTLLQLSSDDEEFPQTDEWEKLRNHPMNDPDAFSRVIIEMGKARFEIQAKEDVGELSKEQAETLRKELIDSYLPKGKV